MLDFILIVNVMMTLLFADSKYDLTNVIWTFNYFELYIHAAKLAKLSSFRF